MLSSHLAILLAVTWIDLAALVLVAVLGLRAFLHALRAKPIQFQRAFKRTRTFWLAVTGVCFAISAVIAVPGLVSALQGRVMLGGAPFFVMLVAATACGVYLVDVKPAVDVESRGPSAW